MELQVESRGTLNRRPQQASLVFEPLPAEVVVEETLPVTAEQWAYLLNLKAQPEPETVTRRCKHHPYATIYQKPDESVPRCALGHPAEKWNIVHVATGTIIGHAHYQYGGSLKAGALERVVGEPEPQKCRHGHVGQMRHDGRCLECRRLWDARGKKES